jgi:hypothetical protein
VIDYVCAHCGSDNISPSSIGRGIDNRPLGFCHDCAEKVPKMPSASDHSEKAERQRKAIIRRTTVGTYRTRLTPLVERDQFQPRRKPVAARPLPLWDAEA